MSNASDAANSVGPCLPIWRRGSGWLTALVLLVFLFFVYLSNGREIGTDDTWSATLLPLYILRGEGIYLEDRNNVPLPKNAQLPFVWTKSHGHVVTLYPIAPAVVAVPFVAVQVAVWDLNR